MSRTSAAGRPVGASAASRVSPFADVLHTKARSFAFAARFLDPERRRATEVLYAFYRTLDDLVDERSREDDPTAIPAELDRWDRWLAEPPSANRGGDPLAAALANTLATYAIPPEYLRALLRGLRDDLEGRPISSIDDLERYSFRVAGSVGLAMCHVLGATSPRALAAAAALGIAMQLTNILRDVGEDLDRGRVYLPSQELARVDGAAPALLARSVNGALRSVLRRQIARARRYYAGGLAGIDELRPEARYPIALAARLYGRILDKLEAAGHDVFARRAAVSRPEKIILACRVAVAIRAGRRQAWARPPGGATAVDPISCLGQAARAELAACGAGDAAGDA